MPIYRWYKNFKVGNITSYDVFEEKFLQDWGVKYDRKYLMNQLYEIKKKDNGIVQLEIFNKIFESVLEKIIHYIKPIKTLPSLFITSMYLKVLLALYLKKRIILLWRMPNPSQDKLNVSSFGNEGPPH